MSLVRNKPTALGREAGSELARLTEVESARLQDAGIPFEEPCAGCAYRRGSYANGCPSTVLEAIYATVEENEIFSCHEVPRRGQVCAGWKILSGFYDSKTQEPA